MELEMRFSCLSAVALAFSVAGPVVFSPAVLAQPSDPAVAPIRRLDDGLIAIMKAGKAAGVKGRAASIAPVIDQVFDVALMTRLSVGTSWTTIAPADQQALVDGFRRMTIAQYASNFDSWSGQSFVIAPEVEARGTDRLVRTTLKDPQGEDVAIAYRLRQNGASWKVIDVFYKNAISQIATRRSDFAAVLQKGGAKMLVTHLDALAAKGAF
jgi:phospholipid transport system substrate-binding protein